jgi:glycosyltransferase involved in cell wall biosynthesis
MRGTDRLVVDKYPYLDTTILHYTDDRRGIAQVVCQLVRLICSDSRFSRFKFIATRKGYAAFLQPLGVDIDRVKFVGLVPLVSRFERFHGLLCTFRYRAIVPTARCIIHTEFRTVLRCDIVQVVLYYDFFFTETAPWAGQKKPTRYWYLMYKCKQSLRADYFATISEYTRRRALSLFPQLDPAAVTAVHLGARQSVRTDTPHTVSRLDSVHFLYVGSLEPRKNVQTLVERFSLFDIFPAPVLHLAGYISDAQKKDIETRIKKNGVTSQIVIHGQVSEEQLKALYTQAHFLLFPSLFEGFGLPVIEAMANGLVVCAFRNTTLPEIGDECIVLCENNDFQGWVAAIAALIRRPKEYDALSRKASRRAEYFSEQMMFRRYGGYFARILTEIERVE